MTARRSHFFFTLLWRAGGPSLGAVPLCLCLSVPFVLAFGVSFRLLPRRAGERRSERQQKGSKGAATKAERGAAAAGAHLHPRSSLAMGRKRLALCLSIDQR